ncbi:hypothetical protein J5N97_020590 [Dioscorea zingiberensis]|uniref:Uncharacterized protein n=1 Tax=Dioscorea zingiberensis TaxID=325984 RepID=A0A9D5HDD6_9LILI|nr:hypothetical protein J5N97_020590 [Dioscorea zingiberensis]
MGRLEHWLGGYEEVDKEEVASPQLWEKSGNPYGVTAKQMMMRYRKEMVELLGGEDEENEEEWRSARSENLGNNLLLKMFVLGNMERRSSFRVNDVHSKVIPKAMTTEGEWWTRKELGESSRSDRTNSNSNHTGWSTLEKFLR